MKINIVDKSESEEIEPHPDLILYFQETQKFNQKLPDNFADSSEHHNIVSNIEQNIFLLKRIEEKGLLPNKISMVDCGIGLGFALYDFYLQSLEFNNDFTFTGIEKQKIYTDFIKENLMNLWNKELILIEDDIMNINYQNYNIIYSYTPYKSKNQLVEFYQKISNEIKTGSIIIENATSGWGHFDILKNIDTLEPIEIDDIVIFIKK